MSGIANPRADIGEAPMIGGKFVIVKMGLLWMASAGWNDDKSLLTPPCLLFYFFYITTESALTPFIPGFATTN